MEDNAETRKEAIILARLDTIEKILLDKGIVSNTEFDDIFLKEVNSKIEVYKTRINCTSIKQY